MLFIKRVLIRLGWWVTAVGVLQAQSYRADVKTVISSVNTVAATRLLLDAARTPAPVGTHIWFVVDRNNDGVPTSPPAGGVLGSDDVLIAAKVVDGDFLGERAGRFQFLGLEVPDRAYGESDVYLYLWSSKQPGDFVPTAGETFGLFRIGKVAAPIDLGNALWYITEDVFANQYTVGGGGGPVGPAITAQPQSQSIVAGSDVTFTVSATGTAPLVYQWFKDGEVLPDATTATLNLMAVTSAFAGRYRVSVSNEVAAVISDEAILTVTEPVVPPTIVTHPASQTVDAGATVTFTVEATGTAPFQYEWRKDGVVIPGADVASLVRTNVTPATDAGVYTVIVSNLADSRTSEPAILTVNATAIPVVMTISAVAEGFHLAWSGGQAPYRVQRKPALSDAGWTDVQTTSETQLTLPAAGHEGFWRVVSP